MPENLKKKTTLTIANELGIGVPQFKIAISYFLAKQTDSDLI